MTQKYKIVKVNTNWADEMDVTGFVIYTEENYNKLVNEVKKFLLTAKEIYIGTNESIEISDLNDWRHMTGAFDISEEQVKLLLKLFGGSIKHKEIVSYGTGSTIASLEFFMDHNSSYDKNVK